MKCDLEKAAAAVFASVFFALARGEEAIKSKVRRKFHLSPSSFANVFTYTLFTIFPVVMFSTILVLKLRGNYLQQIDHLHSTVSKLGLQANSCLSEQENRTKKIHTLEQYQEKCRDTLGKASQTLSALNAAFKMQWERTDKAMAAMNVTRHDFHSIQKEVDTKDSLSKHLIVQNAQLKQQLEDLNQRLHNVTSDKIDLEGQLGKVKIDFDGLKSNTSRLEGEKKGLEKVLEVKAVVKGEGSESGKRHKGQHKSDDDDDDNKEEENVSKKKEKESIEKIVKEHIQKLGLAGNSNGSLVANMVPMPYLKLPNTQPAAAVGGANNNNNSSIVNAASPVTTTTNNNNNNNLQDAHVAAAAEGSGDSLTAATANSPANATSSPGKSKQ